MDAFGHVNNTVYFRYMEIMRIDWLQQRLGKRDSADGPVIVNAFCNFLRQFTFPGDVLARMYVGRVGNTSADTYVTMALSDAPDTVCAEGGARMVWVRYADQKSVPLPATLRELMG